LRNSWNGVNDPEVTSGLNAVSCHGRLVDEEKWFDTAMQRPQERKAVGNRHERRRELGVLIGNSSFL